MSESSAYKGKKRPPETGKKISEKLRGIKRGPQTKEHRAKIGEARKLAYIRKGYK